MEEGRKDTKRGEMRITHSRDKSVTNYYQRKPLKDVDNCKDLGVTVTKDLSWGNCEKREQSSRFH